MLPGEKIAARLIRIGRDPAMSASDARYVVLTNIVALLGVAFMLGFAPILVLTGSWVYPLLQVGYALVHLIPLWLNHRRHHVAATTVMLFVGHAVALIQVLVAGHRFDIELFLLLQAVLPFLLYAPRHEGLMVAISALAGIDLVLQVVIGDRLPALGPVISEDRIAVLRPIVIAGLFAAVAACAYYARRATLIAEAAADRAHERSEELLHNILPPTIASRLKARGDTIADGFGEVSVLFADIVGFTSMSAKLAPERVVAVLNELFSRFDDLADHLGLEKIKTIGDCYMVAGGLPEPRADHAEAVANMALGMLDVIHELRSRTDDALDLRIGIHSGPVVAGVIGKRKFIYDLWGDTVNTASRMESHGIPGAVQVSDTTHDLLAGKIAMQERGTIEVKGKGAMRTWLIER
jgi:adenylate cyclase